MQSRLANTFFAGLISLGLVTSAAAALVPKLGGQVVYDTDRDITWISAGNLAGSNTFGVPTDTNLDTHPDDTSGVKGFIDSDGDMNWPGALHWIDAMNAANYLGFNDWRLPTTLVPDSGCTRLDGSPSTLAHGWDCTGSEMGHLFYDEFGVERLNDLYTGDPDQLAKFSFIQSSAYWSGTEQDTDHAWTFGFHSGVQGSTGKEQVLSIFTLAVRDGGGLLPEDPPTFEEIDISDATTGIQLRSKLDQLLANVNMQVRFRMIGDGGLSDNPENASVPVYDPALDELTLVYPGWMDENQLMTPTLTLTFPPGVLTEKKNGVYRTSTSDPQKNGVLVLLEHNGQVSKINTQLMKLTVKVKFKAKGNITVDFSTVESVATPDGSDPNNPAGIIIPPWARPAVTTPTMFTNVNKVNPPTTIFGTAKLDAVKAKYR